jgi:predicted permease
MAGPDRRWRWLLRLLPSAFRDEHGAEIVRVWRDQQREGERHVWVSALIDTLNVAPREHAAFWRRNLVYAARRAARAPVFTLAVIVTLALGTGATGAVFSLIDAVLLRPLPWRSPESVGLVWAVNPAGTRTWLSFPELDDLRRSSHAAGISDLRPILTWPGGARELQALAVSHDLFTLLGAEPARGRTFTAADEHAGAHPVVILSDAFWQSQYGADPGAVGRTMTIDNREYAIVGVLTARFGILPPSSVFPDRVDVWLPLEPHLVARERNTRFLHALVRVPGRGFAAAATALHAYARQSASRYPAAYPGGAWDFSIVPFQDEVLRAARRSLVPLAALVSLVLAVACANAGSLMLARGAARRGELAVRTALGAGPATLAGELFAESLLLTAAGSAAGLAIAAAVPPILRALDPAALPRLADAGVDLRVVAVMGILIVGIAGVFTAVPLVERMRLRALTPSLALRGGGRSRAAARFGTALATVQIAFATTVIVITAMLGHAFVEVSRAPLGFVGDRLVTARLTLPTSFGPPPQWVQFFDRVVAALDRSPGSAGAAAVTQLPLSGAMLGSTFLVDRGLPTSSDRRIDADLRGVTPRYFDVAGIPFAAGRAFSPHDVATSHPVAIVDRLFARQLAPDGNVVGRRIRWFRQPDVELEIVGVVGAVRHRGPEDREVQTVYRPYAQYVRPSMYVVVKSAGDTAAVTAAMRDAVASIDPRQPVADVATMTQREQMALSRTRSSLLLAGSLALLALTLAVVGVYGVLNFDVAQRHREFGVRMALGAGPSQVRWLVFGRGVAMTFVGVIAGIAGASLLTSMGLHASPALPLTLAGSWMICAAAVALVAASSLVALWVPARRASGADPLAALRD